MFALKRLNPGHFVRGESAFARCRARGRLFISLTDRADRPIPLRILRGSEPIPAAMGLEIGFF